MGNTRHGLRQMKRKGSRKSVYKRGDTRVDCWAKVRRRKMVSAQGGGKKERETELEHLGHGDTEHT